MTFSLVFEQLLNGLQYGVMLFLMAAGLTLVLGIMNMVNLAHGSLYMVGAYLAVAAIEWTGSYPLGVRRDLRPTVYTERLAPGDTLVLLSDGIVEACRDGGDEPFGFPRLSASLERHAGGSPEALVRGVLADLAAFAGRGDREDDVTLVALRLP